ncbi:c-type cytochrome [Rhodovulum adriaticum]|uniref:Cytochrome c2 n=1 Tax=Rhodovulum adriaticum TaxID=35804 RepID=A0A4R2P0Z5_RHOAD|nr:c-type cytochrome [Rhodovulum adriaticum]MBK1635339.1 cytochrome C [Rhodovulum adriaticum]TCP27728.1 cytochrome c [Rhodovulum adriaticum]
MKVKLALAAAAAMSAGPALAVDVSGDAAAGEKAFRQCITCHVVVDDSGETLAGRNAKVGPNLYKVPGRHAGQIEGFRYSDSMSQAGENGLVWVEEEFVKYVQDPTGYLREYLGDSKARGAMTHKVRKEDEAVDIYAYLASLGVHEE